MPAHFYGLKLMLKGEPDFDEKSEVFRHIRAIYYQSDRRAKFPAFMEGNSASRNGLSVNSGEVQTINQVASIYAINSGEDRPVAISIHSVEDYNTAAARVSVNVTYDAGQRAWVFTSADGVEHAYLHDSKTGNPSHCLARFTRHFDGKQAQKFAMRMAYKPRYTMV